MELIILLGGVGAMVCCSRASSVALASELIRRTHLGFFVIPLDCGRHSHLLDEVIELGVSDMHLKLLKPRTNGLVHDLLCLLGPFVGALGLPFFGAGALGQGRLYIVSRDFG
jgi:hypothetical protein